MSKNGSDKERTFTFFQKYKKEIMTDVLGFELDNIKLEKPFGKSKIDFFAVDPLRRVEVYIENQITPSDEVHLNKIVHLINGMNEGVVVWVALRFHHDHLLVVEEELKRNKQKYVDFYAVEVSSDVIEYVSWLDKQFKMHILNNLGIISQVEEPVKLVYKLEQIPKTFVGNAYIGERIYDFNRIEDLRDYIMEKLQEKIRYFPNIHFEKRPSKYGRSIYTGAGKEGTTYILNVKSGSGMAFVELHFDRSQEGLFNKFKLHLPSMQDQIHPDIQFKERKIGVYFKPLAELDDTIDMVAVIFDRMLKYFSPYTYKC
ncbi:hypothetical protein [Cytobacillus horneckiae]|uniref:hypothetical protein n=1 Tax=Cytobacillus horneckiae TaxID=549687 RepID=UPI002DBF5A0C|nr:hypothetical protein [Cytobacillus horneckiae]MEC1157831.1 hypothetical protein [Cytobacillus horneckiae]MED2940725.1 hypothetical protein [Cytobacillus horneckiae]